MAGNPQSDDVRTADTTTTPRQNRAVGASTRVTILVVNLVIVCLFASAAVTLWWGLRPDSLSWTIEPAEIMAGEGHAFHWLLPAAPPHFVIDVSDTPRRPRQSKLRVRENDRLLPLPHSIHSHIAERGGGRYSHWSEFVIFSTSDNSDPRSNGRTYAADVVVRPETHLLIVGVLVLFGILVLFPIRAGDTIRTLVSRLLFRSSSLFLIVAGAGAVLATLSQFDLFHASRDFTGGEVLEQQLGGEDTYHFEIGRFHAPFLEIASSGVAELTWNGTHLTRIPCAEIHCGQPGGLPVDHFIDDGNYVSFRVEDTVDFNDTLILSFPVRATAGAVVLLWVVVLLHLPIAHSLRMDDEPVSSLKTMSARALRGLAGLGAFLLLLNSVGLFLPLRSTLIDPPLPDDIARLGYGRADVTLPWKDARALLTSPPWSDDQSTAHGLTRLVEATMAHIWWDRARTEFSLHVPARENYILWLRGQIHPRYRIYFFGDPEKALERGVGLCSQVSQTLVYLLRERGIDARVVQLYGHTVATAEVAPATWHVLDADYGVVIPASLKAIEADPAMVRPYYAESLARLDHPTANRDLILDWIVGMYGPEGNSIEDAGANTALGDKHLAFERASYRLKWQLPIVLMLPFAISIAVRHWRRTSRSRVAADGWPMS